ncbi:MULTISPECIES: TonB-dependent receptor [unclassified Mucilaginibacter]|uniref:SusC/RagA family TonB-linked outer membrane protein n=1 Tax=unclassified Mucilaginibacter TaxID=2617802 RepID=UPI002AC9AF2E|nr:MULTISPECIES: TonB-dependent receptor [unclassified Mucilaginibacter]MEB0261573.1 TonB-dependent receptor [Mucilaginibacter sp. 10I4]MEB0277175.1 TonB-dependent receptor [Mucilaginibacter sp. 10B2]MEB0300823.1 TonB-dependent receptor [Mucilaginibacter sp. 5C4]WPX25272.1 TonB-dependent receptor [Mucilaginibacter sp. 5C4]
MKKLIYKLSCALILMLFSATALFAQSVTLTGKVTNSTGAVMPGVSISITGTTNGTVSDLDGFYKLSIPNSAINPTIKVSFLGYISQEVPVMGKTVVDIILSSSNSSLSEVVVIGYGTQSKHNLISAVGTVNSKTIESLPVYRVEQVLQGTVAGITVTQNSGSPGSPLTIRLRGTGTAGLAQPLFIVDGLQVPDLNYLNPSDIDNISILKDAAASAIYGARGGNGVVLVQTKTGKRNVDKPSISLDAYHGYQNLGHTPDLMNRDQYVAYYNDYQKLNKGTPISDADKVKLPNTNWYKEVFKKNVPTSNANLSIANGGKNYSYYLSGGDFNQDGLVGGKEGKSNYNRKNLKFNFETDVFKNLTIKARADIVGATRNFLFENQAGPGLAALNFIPALPPIYPAFDPNHPNVPFNPGDLSNPIKVNGVTLPAVGAVTNPFLALLLNNNRETSNINVYNISGTWKPIENLSITSSYAYYQDNSTVKSFYPSFDFRPIQNFFNSFGSLTQSDYHSSYSQWEGNAKYSFVKIKNQALDLLGGFSVLRSSSNVRSLSGSDFFVNTFDQVNFALIRDPTKIVNAIPATSETGLLSYYGRLNYNFKEKYLLSGTIRSDASSLFGPKNRTGIFPSVSAGWIVSEESFLKNSKVIDLLKLRASWGVNGNNFINPYQYSTIVDPNSGPSFGGQNTSGISIPFLANPSVKWERVAQTGLGVDISMFNNSLGITVDYYNKKNSDILIPVGTPIYTGYSTASANSASVKNTGIELLIAYHKSYTSGFAWNASFNIGTNKNEVTSLGANGQPLTGGNIGYIFSDPITRTDIGHPISSFYGFKVDHLDANGNFVFKDINGDGKVDNNDKTYIGNPFPDFTYGSTLGLSYKGFDVSAFIYGSHGNKIYDATVRLDASYANRPVSYGLPGAPRNILGSGGSGDVQTSVSDYYVRDGSFAKLKTLSLGYTLPSSILRSIRLSNLRVYVSGQNIFVITNYKGIDPEIGQSSAGNQLDIGIDRGFYPQPKIILLGIQAKF